MNKERIENFRDSMEDLTMYFNVKLDEGAFMPESAHTADAGYDLKTPIGFCVPAEGSAMVDTGVHIAIPEGYVGFLKAKSGLNVRFGLTGTGTIDSGYTGSIVVKLYNHSDKGKWFDRGDKVIQIVFLPIIKPELKLVADLDSTERGDGGFGSTGR